MPPYPNLFSESLLINETITFLKSIGGSASAVRVVDYVMKIRKPEPNLARLLVSDLTDRDPRLMLTDNTVEFIGLNHEAIELQKTGFVVFDLETTGSKAPPCRITEIGAYRVRNGKVEEEFHTLVNPEMPIPPFIRSLTGISDDMVSGAPKFAEVAAGFMDFIGDSVLVAHNARFDMGFLNHEIGRVYEDYRVGNPSLCTVQLARKLLPNIENHKLNTVANYFSIELLNHHRATDDARATAHIFVNLLKDLQILGIHDLGAAESFKKKLC
ncbi:MAG: 3'-5' exoribonuclease [Saprospiraceae bacterium]|nr:3'-5' exoribonuclease [Pyrinomonadaceae bacterium]